MELLRGGLGSRIQDNQIPVSVFDLFKVGIGISSSHAVGPKRISLAFVRALTQRLLAATVGIEVHIYGSLALSGRSHVTDRAVVFGLMDFKPDTLDAKPADLAQSQRVQTNSLLLAGQHAIRFFSIRQIVFYRDETLPEPPTGMRLVARGSSRNSILDTTSFSVGANVLSPLSRWHRRPGTICSLGPVRIKLSVSSWACGLVQIPRIERNTMGR